MRLSTGVNLQYITWEVEADSSTSSVIFHLTKIASYQNLQKTLNAFMLKHTFVSEMTVVCVEWDVKPYHLLTLTCGAVYILAAS